MIQYILPLLIIGILLASRIQKRNTSDVFLDGAGDGIKILRNIFPALLGVMTAAAMLRASGALSLLIKLLVPITDALGMPHDVLPIALLRPISGGGSLGLLTDILKNSGADSFTGKTASVIMGATETTFYCISVYYAGTRARSTAKILILALLCDAAAAVLAVFAVRFFCT